MSKPEPLIIVKNQNSRLPQPDDSGRYVPGALSPSHMHSGGSDGSDDGILPNSVDGIKPESGAQKMWSKFLNVFGIGKKSPEQDGKKEDKKQKSGREVEFQDITPAKSLVSPQSREDRPLSPLSPGEEGGPTSQARRQEGPGSSPGSNIAKTLIGEMEGIGKEVDEHRGSIPHL